MNNILTIPIYFGPKWIIFFVLLETLTVPLVALSNDIAIKNILYMSIMGFIVAFVCVMVLVNGFKKTLIKHSASLLGIEIDQIFGLWYIGILAGILLMVMFFIQDILFGFHLNEFLTGYFSALVSVCFTLILYQLLIELFDFGITINHAGKIYQFNFAMSDIFLLGVYFGLYELIACPITGLWIPYPEHRLILGIISGIIAGGSGGLLLYLLSRFFPFHAKLTLINKSA